MKYSDILGEKLLSPDPQPCSHTTGSPAHRNKLDGTRHWCGWCGGLQCKTCCWWQQWSDVWYILGRAMNREVIVCRRNSQSQLEDA